MLRFRPAVVTAITFQILKNLLLTMLRFAVVYALFFYLAHFSVAQSLGLTVVGLIAFDAYRKALKVAKKQPSPFEPFWIRIAL